MAWSIDRHVVKGVVENQIPGVVTGQIWLKGLNKPIQLSLRGNCYRDLAGSRLEFENPRPIEGDYTGLDVYQDGSVGDMTASRKVKVPRPDDEQADLQPEDEPFGFCLCNCLYLEWFSDSNGRVLIETVDYRWNISLPRWNLSESEEAAQRQRNQQAMLSFVEQLARAIDADDKTELGAAEMNEFQWEAYLQKSDARSDMLLELFEKYEDHPDCEEIIARAMGWEIDSVEYGDDLDEEDWDELVGSAAEEEGKLDYTPSNPIIASMMDITSRIFYDTESRGLLNDDTGNPWNQLLWHSQMTVSKLIAALESAGEEVVFEPGFVVATLKRALHLLHLTISTLEAASSVDASRNSGWKKEIRRDLFAIRESIIDLMQTYREMRG